jgi:hypothetical protein
VSLLLALSFETAESATAPVPVVVTSVSPFAALLADVDDIVRAAFGELDPDGAPTIVYTPEGGVGVPVSGVFDELYVLAKGDAEAGVETLGPAVFLRRDELPTDPEDDEPTLTIRGADYRVIERRPDGLGGIVLALRLVG